MTTKKEKRTPTGAFIEDVIVGTHRGWQNFITIFFGEFYESYEYSFNAGGSHDTEAEARMNAADERFREQALSTFLQEVPLNMNLEAAH